MRGVRHFKNLINLKLKTNRIMDIKKTLINLAISLIASPIIVYIILFAARAAGSTYEMSHGETWMIWLLMAIVINQSMVKKGS